MRLLGSLFLFCWPLFLVAQTISYDKIQWNAGATISPQMAFVGALDLGAFTNVEMHPWNNKIAVLGGLDIRNKWLQLPASNEGLDTRSLKTHYSISGITYVGLGLSFLSKSEERNSFYFNFSPTLFSFKESVETNDINNTVKSSSWAFHAGVTWTNTRVTKKGRKLCTQFYVPFWGGHFLDNIRFMNLKLGIVLN